MDAFVAANNVVVEFVIVELFPVMPPINPLVNVSPDPDTPEVEAFPNVSNPVTSTDSNEALDDDAMLNGFTPDVPFTLNVINEDVAFTPDTVPLSISSPVESAVGLVNRAKYPFIPPVTPEPLVIPSEDVATQRVEVPVA